MQKTININLNLKRWLFPLTPTAIFLFLFALYLSTTAPKFLFDDNPEFIASAHILGVTHPPGYPLFSLAGKLFTFLIPGEISFSINASSAFFASLALLVFYFLALQLGCGKLPAFMGTLLFGISRTFWSQSIEAEVYALNLFFIAFSLCLFLNFLKNRNISTVLLNTAVLTAGIIIHYSIALILPLYFIYVFLRLPIKKILVVIPSVFLVFYLFFSIMLYLPLRSAAAPPIYWGSPEKWEGFITHLSGVQTLRGTTPVLLSDKLRFLADYIQQFSMQHFSFLSKFPLAMLLTFASFFVIFLIAGLVFLAKKNKDAAVLISAAFLLNIIVFIGFLNYLYSERAVYVVSVFYIPSFFFIALLVACGFQQADNMLKKTPLLLMIVYAALAALIVNTTAANCKIVDKSGDLIAYQYGMNILNTIERDGVLFSPIEVESFPIAALSVTEGQRRDVQVYGHHGTRASDVYFTRKMDVPYQDVKALSTIETHILTTQLNSIPIYYTIQRPFINNPQFKLLTDGLVYRLNPPQDEILAENPLESYQTDGVSLKGQNYDYVTRSVVSKYYLRRAERLLQEKKSEKALTIIEDILRFNPRSRFLHATAAGIHLMLGDLNTAAEEYKKALAVPPEHVEISVDTVAIYTNLSFIYGRMGDQDEALKMIENAAQLAPDMAVVQLNLGQTYWQMDNCEKAITPLERAARLGMQTAPMFNILGICYEKANKLEEAEKNYKKSIELDPEYPDVYRDIGVFYAYKKKDSIEATQMLQRYLQLAPDTPDKFQILINIAIMYYYLEDCESSLNYFHKALTINPNPTAKQLNTINSIKKRCYQ
ncbi:MAG: DUF2723 domain-containing protein [bacterium]